eukprot:SAG31_NODE_16516_length_706_cov_0.831960_2_plen_59_part_01
MFVLIPFVDQPFSQPYGFGGTSTPLVCSFHTLSITFPAAATPAAYSRSPPPKPLAAAAR